MQIKNSTPFLFGYRSTSRRPPQPEMTAIVRATFAIRPGSVVAVPEGNRLESQGSLTGETFRDGDDDRAGECLRPDDLADFKLHGEVMLRGICHAPNQRPLPECPVRFAVGAWSKILRVIGPRVWTDGLM